MRHRVASMRALGRGFSRDAALAAVFAAAVFGVYMLGAGRPFNLDASVTVARYVATPSLLDPLQHQFVYNNHVFFSLADHVVYSVTGSRSEIVLRLLPVVAAAIALGLLALVLARWTGSAAALVATALAAWTPLMLANCREVRGYSFLLLSATLSTALFIWIRRGPGRVRGLELAYVASLAFGVATHAYAAAVMLLHAAALGADRRALREWAPRWAAALVVGLLALAGVAHEMLSAGGSRGRVFQPRFPLNLGRELLGGAAVPVVVTGVLAALGAAELLGRAAWA